MKKLVVLSLVLFCLMPFALSQTRGLKVFISVDMEGISGVVHKDEVSSTGKDYQLFRAIMTEETNAAIDGAFAAGAREVWVRDSHGSARNILPDRLDKRAKLIREWTGAPEGMMDGIDHTFDAVVFIGYHAKAGTADATLDHTNSSVKIQNASINGISLPEAGFNALIAGYHDVPVVFLSGDRAICTHAKELFGEIETVAVKEGMGNAALCLHPDVSFNLIRKGVEKALDNLGAYKPYHFKSPFILDVQFHTEQLVNDAIQFPGVKRTGDWSVQYTGTDLMEVIKVFRWLY